MDDDYFDHFFVLEHRYADIGPNTTRLYRLDCRRMTFGIGRVLEVYVHRLLRSQHAAERAVSVWLEAAASFVDFGRHVVGRDDAQPASFVQNSIPNLASQQSRTAGCRASPRLEYRRKLTGRAGNDLQHLRRLRSVAPARRIVRACEPALPRTAVRFRWRSLLGRQRL